MVKKHYVLLIVSAVFGFALILTGILIDNAYPASIIGLLLTNVGAAILFPILVGIAYDQIRERWFGNEVWRIFSELADAGITRIYRDRERSSNPENAEEHLRKKFGDCDAGEILMIGVSLRVFFNEVGPYYGDIAAMLKRGHGRIKIRALICDRDSPELDNRRQIEDKEPGDIFRELDATAATVRRLNAATGAVISLRTYLEAPYSTVIIFPDECYFSPNILSPVVPVRLPMIVFRYGSHGYDRLKESFNYIWERSTMSASPEVKR